MDIFQLSQSRLLPKTFAIMLQSCRNPAKTNSPQLFGEEPRNVMHALANWHTY